MLFDTDILIWFLRGNARAAKEIEMSPERALSVMGYMELLSGARSRREMNTTRQLLREMEFKIVPLSENIGHRAAIYLEQFVLGKSMGVVDALIAATALENRLTLCTANRKHYSQIPDLTLRVFRP